MKRDTLPQEREERSQRDESEELRARKGFICDMDGVIYLGSQLLPGVREFVSWLNENDKKFLF